MTNVAIRVENLGKKYKIGGAKQGSFRESFSRKLTHLFSKNGKATSSHNGQAVGMNGTPLDTSGEFWALKDINFEIKRGEAVGIIGRNGAGKSTLLKILSRITKPTTGRYEVFGRVSSLLEVGTGFHPELTGRENVYLNGTILGMKRAEVKAKFDEIVAFSGVEKFIDTPVKHYSSGMQVRLAFAVAAHLEPEILIIDEVLAVGDAEFQKKCLGKMEDVAGEGRTVLFVSHNMGAVQKLCNIGFLLSKSKLLYQGQTDLAISYYLSKESIVSSNSSLLEFERDKTEYGNLVRIASCELFNEKGKNVNEINLKEKFKVKLAIKSFVNIKSCSVIVGIDTLLGINVSTIASEETGLYFDLKEGEVINISLSFNDVFLNSGSYSLRVGIRKGKEPLDLVQKALVFHVSTISSVDSFSFAGLHGIIKSIPIWSTQKL